MLHLRAWLKIRSLSFIMKRYKQALYCCSWKGCYCWSKDMSLCDDIRFLTNRALWETENLIKCIPDELWDKRYDGLPIWKYLYHTLYSLDRWYVNPGDSKYQSPEFHTETLADLNVVTEEVYLERKQLELYFFQIREKIQKYIVNLNDNDLTQNPKNCELSRFRLILGQFRHWHRHVGIL